MNYYTNKKLKFCIIYRFYQKKYYITKTNTVEMAFVPERIIKIVSVPERIVEMAYVVKHAMKFSVSTFSLSMLSLHINCKNALKFKLRMVQKDLRVIDIRYNENEFLTEYKEALIYLILQLSVKFAHQGITIPESSFKSENPMMSSFDQCVEALMYLVHLVSHYEAICECDSHYDRVSMLLDRL